MEELIDVTVEETPKKRRTSTSEKAKAAAAAREEAAVETPVVPAVKAGLDPLRLRGKRYRTEVAKVDRTKKYTLEEAIALVQATSSVKFDASVEVHVQIKNDGVRGTLDLPHGTGKTKKVAVATDEVIEQITAGKFDFDVLLATPAQMPKLAKLARTLGPKGLMPSPKAGTVVEKPEEAMAAFAGGRVEYRADKTKVVHLGVGRVSFKPAQIKDNIDALLEVLQSARILSVSLASSMGPGVKVQL